MATDEPQALLSRAERYWSVIRDALLNPEEWDDQEWQSEVAEIILLYDLVARVRPSNPEEEARLQALRNDMEQVAAKVGLVPIDL
ncbi:hypothetical protein [Meiothermus taiwanensis]|uniref:hypothetical protein n=1 Tax=Meiothermus taiwanensis TaxID=172827 RepID=UPI001F519745|nr:hypothetical protein [Meiothermus taiwanensis]